MLLYSKLASWYRLIDPVTDHEEEAGTYRDAFVTAIDGATTLLELGAGGGHNASYLKRDFRCTLTDVSGDMLSLSRELNPECEHLKGDMRTLRLGETFDAVLIHDAVVYMTSEKDVLAAATTAFVHTRPGGAAIIAPDYLAETFHEASQLIQGADGPRALRGVEWAWDPDPDDGLYTAEYAFLLREHGTVTAVHDRHLEGLFSEATWHRLLSAAGFGVETLARPIGEGQTDRIFLCRRR